MGKSPEFFFFFRVKALFLRDLIRKSDTYIKKAIVLTLLSSRLPLIISQKSVEENVSSSPNLARSLYQLYFYSGLVLTEYLQNQQPNILTSIETVLN